MNFLIRVTKLILISFLIFYLSESAYSINSNYKYASITSSDMSIASLESQFYHLFKTSDSCNKIRTIVIDPGHGGKDHGCSGHGATEKTICLSLGLTLKKRLKEAHHDLKVVMTREKDVFIPLHQRAKIANDHHADLFISIHCNSSSANSRASGSETYVLGLHHAKDNLNVAKRENSSILLESNYQNFYGGFDPNAPETHILLSMFQNVHLDQSILLADMVEEQSRNKSNRNSRGVKQAGFAVLRLTTMPSILFETGFLSNKKEAAFLKSRDGAEQTVSQLLTAITSYRASYEKDCATDSPEVVLAGSTNRVAITTSITEKAENTYWSIQLAAVTTTLDKVPTSWLDLPTIYSCTFENSTKYYTGRYVDKKGLKRTLARVKEEINQDAFIVKLPRLVTIASSNN